MWLTARLWSARPNPPSKPSSSSSSEKGAGPDIGSGPFFVPVCNLPEFGLLLRQDLGMKPHDLLCSPAASPESIPETTAWKNTVLVPRPMDATAARKPKTGTSGPVPFGRTTASSTSCAGCSGFDKPDIKKGGGVAPPPFMTHPDAAHPDSAGS